MVILFTAGLAALMMVGSQLEFVQPTDSVLAGRTQIKLNTPISEDEIVGIELFINGQSAHYFDEPPFGTTIDMKAYAQGPILLRAVLETYEGKKVTAEFKGTNIAPDLEENVTMVRVPVLVDQPGMELRAENFKLLENGRPQKLRVMLGEDKPIYLMAVLDTSTSMEKRILLLRNAMNALIDQTQPGDILQVIGFNHRVFEVSGPETDMQKVRDRLKLLEAKGDTNLYGALWSGIKTLAQSTDRRALLLFTDGDHTVDTKDDLYRKNLDECIEQAKASGIPVYTIGYGVKVNRKDLQRLSDSTGGKAVFQAAPSKLSEVFETIGKDLRRQYLLCYYTRANIGSHSLEVKVDQEGLVLHYPKTFYLSAP